MDDRSVVCVIQSLDDTDADIDIMKMTAPSIVDIVAGIPPTGIVGFGPATT